MRPDQDVTHCGFHHETYKPSKLRVTSIENPDTLTLTVNPVTSLPTGQKLREVQNAAGLNGRNELLGLVSTMNENENLKKGRLTGVRRGGKVA